MSKTVNALETKVPVSNMRPADVPRPAPAAEAPRRRGGLRFSLATLVLGCALAGATVLLYLSNRELGEVRDTNKTLNDELGVLAVNDPDRVQVLFPKPMQQTLGEPRWRWQVYLPAGRNYFLRYAVSDIPEAGLPGGTRGTDEGLYLEGGAKHALELFFRKTDLGWRFVIDRSSVENLEDDLPAGVAENYDTADRAIAGEGKAEDVPADRPMTLLRLRLRKHMGPGSTALNKEPCAGFLLWIEAAK